MAVANALPTLQEPADRVIAGSHGAGVTELINGLLEDDLAVLGGGVVRYPLVSIWVEMVSELVSPSGSRF